MVVVVVKPSFDCSFDFLIPGDDPEKARHLRQKIQFCETLVASCLLLDLFAA